MLNHKSYIPVFPPIFLHNWEYLFLTQKGGKNTCHLFVRTSALTILFHFSDCIITFSNASTAE
jgi:hypothetical protein